jgi:hypothetical protein
MPLQDHFHPPLSTRRHWHAFHNSWATYLSSDLNRQLPEGYFAEANVQFGIEIDVAAFEETDHAPSDTAPGEWSPPGPTCSVAFTAATDVVEVQIYSREEGPTLAGAIELVSPANKDRTAHRDAFVAKCLTYLQQGIGLVIVDVVTDRQANLHNELCNRLNATQANINGDLYAVSYRAVTRNGQTSLDLWQIVLQLGHALPVLPLWLPGGLLLRVDLEATYERTCQEQRVSRNGS